MHHRRATFTRGRPVHLLLVAAIFISSAAAIIDPRTHFDSTTLQPDAKDAYIAFIESSDLIDDYSSSALLPSSSNDGGAAVFWSVDDEAISFAVVVRATGWVGLGVSESGGMKGSDVALYESDNPNVITDAHVVDEYAAPLVDDCPSDWKYEDSYMSEDGEWMAVKLSRKLDTGDPQDWPINQDDEMWNAPTRLIAAWGNEGTVSYHAGGNMARGLVRVYAQEEYAALEDLLTEQSDGYFDVRASDFEIPPRETKYQEFCKSFDELGIDDANSGSIMMIGALPMITDETRAHVHHFTVYVQASCQGDFVFPRSMIYVWAPGKRNDINIVCCEGA